MPLPGATQGTAGGDIEALRLRFAKPFHLRRVCGALRSSPIVHTLAYNRDDAVSGLRSKTACRLGVRSLILPFSLLASLPAPFPAAFALSCFRVSRGSPPPAPAFAAPARPGSPWQARDAAAPLSAPASLSPRLR